MQEIGSKENCKMCRYESSLKPIDVKCKRFKKKRLKVENPMDRQRKKVVTKTRKNLRVDGKYSDTKNIFILLFVIIILFSYYTYDVQILAFLNKNKAFSRHFKTI